MKKKKPKFQRTRGKALPKLGSRQKSKQKYRKATGRHNKIREKRKNRPRRVEIGYRTEGKTRGLIMDKKTVVVNNLKDLNKVGKEEIMVVGRIGDKKKIELVNAAKEKGIGILNVNVDRFLKKSEKPFIFWKPV